MAKSIQDKVILIINGLSESGRVLAEMLAQKGSDIGIVDTRVDTELANRIRQAVRANGRRCLIVTPDSAAAAKRFLPRYAIQKIVDTLGRLDAFVCYSAVDSKTEKPQQKTGHKPHPIIFDRAGLTKAAIRHILTQKHA